MQSQGGLVAEMRGSSLRATTSQSVQTAMISLSSGLQVATATGKDNTLPCTKLLAWSLGTAWGYKGMWPRAQKQLVSEPGKS